VRVLILAFLFGALAWNLQAQAPPCQSVKTLAGSPTAYRNRGNRCEGLYEADVASNNLELISLTQGDIHYELTPGTTLHVSASPRAGALHVRAVAKPPKTYYRMDADLMSGSVLTWPVEDVLLPAGLGENRIGVFAWTGPAEAKTFIPVVVQGELGAQRPQKEVFLSIRPSFDTEAFKWRTASFSDDTCASFGAWRDASRTPINAGQSVKINLGLLAVAECVEVAANSQSSNDWTTMRIRVGLP
jgi:hypothetical protein